MISGVDKGGVQRQSLREGSAGNEAEDRNCVTPLRGLQTGYSVLREKIMFSRNGDF